MLALVTDEYEMPLGLKEFEDIINEKPNQPLAFIPLSDEEEVKFCKNYFDYFFIIINVLKIIIFY